MSMLNKEGNVFTLLGIQEDKEMFLQGCLGSEIIRLEDVESLLGRNGVFRSHHSNTDYSSPIQKWQDDE